MTTISFNCLPRSKDYLCTTTGSQILFFLLLFLAAQKSEGQEGQNYDEVAVLLVVPQAGNTEISSLIKKEEAYLSAPEFFEFLKIKNSTSQAGDSLSGFFITPDAPFLIDKNYQQIIYAGKRFPLQEDDLVSVGTSIYLRSRVFGHVFGLHCQFNFRHLAVTLSTTIELPAIRDMRQALMRQNVQQLKNEKVADTTIAQRFSFFQLGMADWSVTTTQTKGSMITRASLAMGARLAGGEANAFLNFFSDRPLNSKDQYYRWRYVNNDISALRQVTLGRLMTPSSSSIFAPITGIQVTNTPTTFRKSFGTYTISNHTEPGWIVELYVNNVLIDYQKADASGFYMFEVPLLYGNTAIKLRFYGPWGEERTKEESISVPFNFLPQQQFEYTVNAGVVDDENKSRFSRANLSYGLNKRITIGAGMEYLSSVNPGKPMTFINGSFRLQQGLILAMEHTNGVFSKGSINYRASSGMQLDLSYTKYIKGQKAVKFNYLEEQKLALSMPLKWQGFSSYTRLTLHRFIIPGSTYTQGELLFSMLVKGVSSNLTTFARFSDRTSPFVHSNLSLGFNLAEGIRFRPQVQYEYSEKKVVFLKGEIEKRLSTHGFLSFSYESNRQAKSSLIGVTLRMNFSFAQTFFSAFRNQDGFIATQSAKGNLMYNEKRRELMFTDQSNIGRGGIMIIPFLDVNCNGKRDINEPKVPGLTIRTKEGRVYQNLKDTTLLVTGLEAFTNCRLELDANRFENIAWQLKHKSLLITVEPNRFREVEVAVAVVGEVSGNVYLSEGTRKKGIGRILVSIYNHQGALMAKVLSDADGFFSYLGLAPGTYTAQIDGAQLNRLSMKASSPHTFTIKATQEGDLTDDLAFTLHPLSE